MLVSVGICNAEDNSTWICQVDEITHVQVIPCYVGNLVTVSPTETIMTPTPTPTPVPQPANIVLISSEELWGTENVNVIAFNDTRTICVMAHATVSTIPSIACVPMSKEENLTSITSNVDTQGTYDDNADSITVLTFTDDKNRVCAITHANSYLVPGISCYERNA